MESNKKELKGILVHLDVELADKFYELAKSGKFYNKKTPTALARELVLQFLDQHSETV
jgi:hypothetical protein